MSFLWSISFNLILFNILLLLLSFLFYVFYFSVFFLPSVWQFFSTFLHWFVVRFVFYEKLFCFCLLPYLFAAMQLRLRSRWLAILSLTFLVVCVLTQSQPFKNFKADRFVSSKEQWQQFAT